MLNFITWDFSPAIFTIGSFEVRYYGLLWAMSFWIGYVLVKKMFQKEGHDEALLDGLLYSIIFGAVLGARLGHVFFYDWPYYSEHMDEILNIRQGGLASHGGVVGVLIGVALFAKYKIKKSTIWVMDKIAVPGALAGFLIRLGNFLNSEIYGDQTDKPWGVIFIRDGQTVPTHPAQLYEGLSYLLIFFLLYYLYHKKQMYLKEGKVFGVFLITVFTVRIFVEYVKESQGGIESYFGGAFSTGQLLSMPFIIVGLYLFFRKDPIHSTEQKNPS